MFELIVLALVVAALAALARTPVPKDPSEPPTRAVLPLWTTQTDWSRFQNLPYRLPTVSHPPVLFTS
jgi:hypothetical protein